MARKTRQRPHIGDIIEVVTSKGFAYAQYTHEHLKPPPSYGSLIRVLPGIYGERPRGLSELCQQKEQFRIFFPLRDELRRSDTVFSIIGNEKIPDWASAFPVFRNGLPDREGKIHKWWLWDGENEWEVGRLTDEQVRSYPELGIANDTALIEMIENGWTSWHPSGRV